MNPEKIDEILASEEECVPSSGFLASVMDRVQAEASAPPPIPFPWKRALPGMALAVLVLGWSGVEVTLFAASALAGLSSPPSSIALAVPHMIHLGQVGWIAVAAGVSLLSWVFTRRMIGGSALL